MLARRGLLASPCLSSLRKSAQAYAPLTLRLVSPTLSRQHRLHSSPPVLTPSSPSKSVSLKRFSTLHSYLKLIRPELTALVCVTTFGGYVMAGGSLCHWVPLVGAVAGTALNSMSASAWNQIDEREYDAKMVRTSQRPLVTGAISLQTGSLFRWATLGAGFVTLGLTTNLPTALLGLFTTLLYAKVYTPWKRKDMYNTEVGAIVGALPPVMGSTASMAWAGLIDPVALIMLGTLWLWQMSHFMVIAYRNRKDYAQAGYQMRSVVDPTGTPLYGLKYTMALCVLPTVACSLTGLTDSYFVAWSILSGGFLLYPYARFVQNPSKWAKTALFAGFYYLVFFIALLAFSLDRERVPAIQETFDFLKSLPRRCRNVLKYAEREISALCKSHKELDAPEFCPVVVGEEIGKVAAEKAQQQQQTKNV